MMKIIARRMKGDAFGYTIEMYEDGELAVKEFSSYKPVLSNGSIIFETKTEIMSLSAPIIRIQKED